MQPQDFNLKKAAYTVDQLSEVLPASRATIYRDIKEGKLKATKNGKRTWFLAPDIAAYLVGLQEAGVNNA